MRSSPTHSYPWSSASASQRLAGAASALLVTRTATGASVVENISRDASRADAQPQWGIDESCVNVLDLAINDIASGSAPSLGKGKPALRVMTNG
jgi:hypothetical protein